MTKRLILLISAVTLGVASAADTVNVNLYQPTTVSGTEFKTGEAKFLLKDNKVTLKQGKLAAEAAVKVESNNAKYSFTSIVYKDDHSIKEIYVGGTTTRIVFESPSSAPSAAGQK
jgi:hypothetical protein